MEIENNLEMIKEQKQKKTLTKEMRKEYNKKYFQENKKDWKKKYGDEMMCEGCGTKLTRYNISKHLKSAKHKRIKSEKDEDVIKLLVEDVARLKKLVEKKEEIIIIAEDPVIYKF